MKVTNGLFYGRMTATEHWKGVLVAMLALPNSPRMVLLIRYQSHTGFFFILIIHYSYSDYLAYDERPHPPYRSKGGYPTTELFSAHSSPSEHLC